MSRAATARLFLAVDPPAAVCEALCAWAREAVAGLSSPSGADVAVTSPERRTVAHARMHAGAHARRGRPSGEAAGSEGPVGAAGGARRARTRPLRVLHPHSLHLTLAFLGSRPVAETDTIGTALRDCAEAVGELSLGAPAWLPARHPRALAVEVRDPDGELESLHGAVGEALSRTIDWEPERRRFRAHITVLRVPASAAGDVARGGAALSLPATPALSFTPAELVLYRSWLSPTGAEYEPLASWALGDGAP